MKAADLDEPAILTFIAAHSDGIGCSHTDQGDFPPSQWGYMPTVYAVVPPATPEKVVLAKMRALLKRGLVRGCGCGCRGDWTTIRLRRRRPQSPTRPARPAPREQPGPPLESTQQAGLGCP